MLVAPVSITELIPVTFLSCHPLDEDAMIDIPQAMMASAYLSQGGEAAWDKGHVLEVIQWATTSGIAVFGIEVWLPTEPGPTIPMPFFYSYDSEPNENEEWMAFVKRANAGASRYVKEFDWDSEDHKHRSQEPYFNLTLGNS